MNIRQNFRALYQRALSSSFLKSVLTLSSGVVVAQGINFLGMPVVGRVYDPTSMGDYTIITSNAGVIMSVACLGMMTVFMLPEKDEEARGLTRLVTYSTLLITTLAILGLWLCSPFYQIFQTVETPYILSLLVLWIYIVSYTVSNICYAYVNRQKLYRVMFWNPIISTGISVCLGIIFGLLGWGFLGYTAAHILSFLVNILHLLHHANPYERITDPAFHCIPLLKSYRRFPLYQMPANLLSSLSQQIPIQMLETFYSSTTLGMYSMTQRILWLPISLLASPINRVYFQEASHRYSKGEDIGEFSFKILETNIKAAIPPLVLLILFGEGIFSLFLGEQWREAGSFAAIMCLYYLISFCSNCISGGLVILRRNNLSLAFSFLALFLNVLLLLIVSTFRIDIYPCLMLISAFDIFRNLWINGLYFKLTGISYRRYFLFNIKYIVLPIGAAWVCRLLILK